MNVVLNAVQQRDETQQELNELHNRPHGHQDRMESVLVDVLSVYALIPMLRLDPVTVHQQIEDPTHWKHNESQEMDELPVAVEQCRRAMIAAVVEIKDLITHQ